MEYQDRVSRLESYLKTVNAGDVIITVTYNRDWQGGPQLDKFKVYKVTPTQITILINDGVKQRFLKSNGELIGSPARTMHRNIVDPDWAKDIRKDNNLRIKTKDIKNHLSTFDWNNFRPSNISLLKKALKFVTRLEEERLKKLEG